MRWTRNTLITAVQLLAHLTWAAASSEPTLKVHDGSFVPDAVLRVSAQNTSVGCIERYSAVVNGTTPGPQLRFETGSVVWIRVYNEMSDRNLTMHWHGLTMAAAPFSDGSPSASQWPIAPLKFFDYEISLVDVQPGTYFYHSHVGFQALTATGPLIVTEKAGQSGPYQYDVERNVVFTDLFNTTDANIEDGLTASPFKWSGEVGAVLVNGRGIYNDTAPNAAPSCGLEHIDVEPGKTYRLRFIGSTALSFLSAGIEAHNLTLIEVDGGYIQPVETSFLQIGAGQRYSALLKTLSCEQLASRAGDRRQFYMQLETRDRPANLTAYAILDYGAKCRNASDGTVLSSSVPPSTPPLQLPPTVQGWLDYDLHQLSANITAFPSADSVTRTVTITLSQLEQDGHVLWQENGLSWFDSTPRIPYLVALYTNAAAYLPDYDYAIANNGTGRDDRVGAFPALMGEVLEIVVQNTGSYSGGVDVHPMHFHGAHYYYLGSGRGTYDRAENEKRLAGKVPALRDTTMLYRYSAQETPGAPHSWIAWRIRVTEPGVWMLHCHTLQHMIMGMQTVWVFGNSTDIMTAPKPMVKGYLEFGGDVYGDDEHHPTMLHYFDGRSNAPR